MVEKSFFRLDTWEIVELLMLGPVWFMVVASERICCSLVELLAINESIDETYEAVDVPPVVSVVPVVPVVPVVVVLGRVEVVDPVLLEPTGGAEASGELEELSLVIA
jgi:hypothetical protein